MTQIQKLRHRIDATDRLIITATQDGLPLVPRPYDEIARQTGLDSELVKQRMSAMLTLGIIRRMGVVPNHYRLGFTANGMSVWDVDEAQMDRIGALVGGLDYVSHCYQRPKNLPLWPYNFFAMVHGRSRPEVEEKVAQIADLVGEASHSHSILYSSKILKKTGIRLKQKRDEKCSD